MNRLILITDNNFNYNIDNFHTNNIGSQCELILDNLINEAIENSGYNYEFHINSDFQIIADKFGNIEELQLIFYLKHYNSHILSLILLFFNDFVDFEFNSEVNKLTLFAKDNDNMIYLLKKLKKYNILYNKDIKIIDE